MKSALKDTAVSLEGYKLLKYEALRLRFHPKPVGEYLKAEAETKGSDPVDYESIEPWTRVSPHDYESNIREMARLAMAKARKVVLLDNELWDGSPYRPVLRRISAELGVPLVDSLALVSTARAEDSARPRGQARPGVAEAASSSPVPPASGRTPVVFRVFRGATAVPKAFFIVGSIPNSARERRTRSRCMTMEPVAISGRATASGATRRACRPGSPCSTSTRTAGPPGSGRASTCRISGASTIPPASGRPVYLPIDTFGRVYMQGDDWHTDKVGYDLISHAVAREIESFH